MPNDYLTMLAQQTLGLAKNLQPVVPSLFAPPAPQVQPVDLVMVAGEYTAPLPEQPSPTGALPAAPGQIAASPALLPANARQQTPSPGPDPMGPQLPRAVPEHNGLLPEASDRNANRDQRRAAHPGTVAAVTNEEAEAPPLVPPSDSVPTPDDLPDPVTSGVAAVRPVQPQDLPAPVAPPPGYPLVNPPLVNQDAVVPPRVQTSAYATAAQVPHESHPAAQASALPASPVSVEAPPEPVTPPMPLVPQPPAANDGASRIEPSTAGPRRAPEAAGEAADAPPVVRITIGRVEVRAAPPTPAPQPPQSSAPRMSLDDYLRGYESRYDTS